MFTITSKLSFPRIFLTTIAHVCYGISLVRYDHSSTLHASCYLTEILARLKHDMCVDTGLCNEGRAAE